MNQQGKRCVLITGATVNSGRGIAEKFASEGYTVFVGSRSQEKADAVAQELTERFGVSSVGYGMIPFDEADVKRIFADIAARGYLLDCLVLSAADLGIGQHIFDVPFEDFMNVINVNMGWNFLLSREAARQMKEQGHGSIVFINSNTAYRAVPDRIAYSASKSGALGMMRAMALDLGKFGIRVNAVLPGMIKTDRWENNLNGCKEALSNHTPLHDIADFADIAEAAYYFGSDASKNTTGAELVVDGGNTIQLCPTY